MKYCKECVQPDTRPGIFLDKNGVCSGCIGHKEKELKINWDERKQTLEKILNRFRSKNGEHYDCVIPVSGGKDSTYQVVMAKKIFNMKPLAVTYRYADRTDIGQENLDNLRKIGVDHIEIAPNPNVERKFIKKSLIEAGDPCLPDHMGIYSVGLKVAVYYKVPLIIWGESPQLEYGGTAEDRDNPYLNREWLSKHGCLQGKSAEDWVDNDLTLSDMSIYRVPSDEELNKAKITSIFLGYYLQWDPFKNYEIAKKVGFKKSSNGTKMGLYDFADLDSTNMIVHHYIKWLKFGMTRLNDNISVEIRNGRMSREKGIRILRSQPERIPQKEIRNLCLYLGMQEHDFWNILEKFRNKNIWKKNNKGGWFIPDYLKGV